MDKIKTIVIGILAVLCLWFIAMGVYNTFFREDAPEKVEIINPLEKEDDNSEIIENTQDKDGNFIEDYEDKGETGNKDLKFTGNIVSVEHNGYKVSFGTEGANPDLGLVLNPNVEYPENCKYLVYASSTTGSISAYGKNVNAIDGFSNIKYIYTKDESLTGKCASYIDDTDCGIIWNAIYGENTGSIDVTIINYTNFEMVGTFRIEVGTVDGGTQITSVTVDSVGYDDYEAKALEVIKEKFPIFEYFTVDKVYIEKVNNIYYNKMFDYTGYNVVYKSFVNTDKAPFIAVSFTYKDASIIQTVYFSAETGEFIGRESFDLDSCYYDLEVELGIREEKPEIEVPVEPEEPDESEGSEDAESSEVVDTENIEVSSDNAEDSSGTVVNP